jgi:hypothetical protein
VRYNAYDCMLSLVNFTVSSFKASCSGEGKSC